MALSSLTTSDHYLQFQPTNNQRQTCTKNFIVSHTSYEQEINPNLPLCCSINSIQTTVTTNITYREVYPSAILPTFCYQTESPLSEEEEEDIFYYYSTSDLSGKRVYKEACLLPKKDPTRSYLLIDNMGSGSSTHNAAVGISASHNNMVTKPSKFRRSSFSSDNGGFETHCNSPEINSKSHMGVRERLRSSLDKISLKPAFRWGSSDKIQSNTNQSKSKNKKFRSDDSPQIRTDLQSPAVRHQKHRLQNTGSSCSELERIHVTNKSSYDRIHTKNSKKKTQLSDDCNRPDYIAVGNHSSKTVGNNKLPDNGCYDRKQLVTGDQSINLEFAETLKTDREVFSRAKGNWNMLRMNNSQFQTRYRPVKAPSGVLSCNISASSENLQNTQPYMNNEKKKISCSNYNLSTYEFETEPPKLTPVSGKLLQQQYIETTILRPTAFKVVPRRQKTTTDTGPSQQNLSPTDMVVDTGSSIPPATSCNNQIPTASSRKSCASDSDSGLLCSGRNSSTSIQQNAVLTNGISNNSNSTTAITTTTGNVSCSASSEGYDSACISLAQSNQIETEINCSEASPLVLHKVSNNLNASEDYIVKTDNSTEDNQQITDKFDNYYSSDHLLPATIIDVACIARHQSSSNSNSSNDLRLRLEDVEVEMQRRRDEVSRLQRQLKEQQDQLTDRASEAATLRSRNRSLFSRIASRDRQLADVITRLEDREATCAELQRRLADANERCYATADDVSRDQRASAVMWSIEREKLMTRLQQAEDRIAQQNRRFELERQQWAVDKARVIRYQKQLQDNYTLIYKRSNCLEQENNKLINKLRHITMTSERHATITSSVENPTLSYPMDI